MIIAKRNTEREVRVSGTVAGIKSFKAALEKSEEVAVCICEKDGHFAVVYFAVGSSLIQLLPAVGDTWQMMSW